MKVFIYCLKDPITDELRYIGKSLNPKRRFTQHLWEASRGIKTHKNNWIRKIISSGNVPVIEILEECDESNWAYRERYWIDFFSNVLTNATPGGDGVLFHTDETRKKISLKSQGRVVSESAREKIRIKLTGIKRSAETNRLNSESKMGSKNPMYGVRLPRTDEWKRKAAESNFKPVIQLTKDGIYINRFPSLTTAANTTGIVISSISFCLSGRYKTAGGFKWKWA